MQVVGANIVALVAASGIATASAQWRSVDANGTEAVFFDQASLRQINKNIAQADFASAWKVPDDAIYPSFKISGVSVVVERWKGDCVSGTITLTLRDYYSDSGMHLKRVKAATLVPVTPKGDSRGSELLNLLCGRPEMLGDTFAGGPAELVRVVRERRVEPKPRPTPKARP